MRNKSLRFKLTLYFFIIITTVLFVVSILNFIISRNIIRKQIEKNTVESIDRSGAYVADYVKKLKDTASALSKDENILEFTKSDDKQVELLAKKLLNTILDSDENFTSGLVISKDGRIISNEEKIEMATSENMMEEAWYQEAIAKKAMPVLTSARQNELGDESKTWVISVTREIVDENNNNLGVIRLDIPYQAIEGYLDKLDLGKEGYLFIISDDLKIVYHPDKKAYTSTKEMQDMLYIAKLEDGYSKDNNRFIKHYTIPDSHWILVGVASFDEIDIIAKQLIIYFTIIGAIVFIASHFGIFIIIKRWMDPLNNLMHTMREIEKGNSFARAKVGGSIEFRLLAASFNDMLDKINDLMEDIMKKEGEIRKYEFEALSSQINPHFLYNTLDTIIWMAEFNDSKSVVEITKALAKFFRLSLNQGNEIIKLKNELDHIRQYLFIQKQRYGDKLNYEIIECPIYDDYELPKLVLQPIVENAIYHGIKELDRDGFIKIEVLDEVENIKIIIEDNGNGFKKNKENSNKRLGGVGIKNVNKRLELHFGNVYHMEIDSKEGEYTKVIYYLPKKSNKEKIVL